MAASKKAKQLTSKDLLALDADLDITQPITIAVKDKNFTININTHFRQSKLEVVAAKFITFVQQLRSMPDISEETIIGTFKLIPTLLIKEFSDVPIEQDVSNLNDLIQVQSSLGDLGVLKQVYEAFDPKEVEKAKLLIQGMAQEVGQLTGELAVQHTFKELEQHGDKEPDPTGSSNQ